MTGSHPLISLLICPPARNRLEPTNCDEQDGHPGQDRHDAEEVGRGRGKEDRDERDYARNGEKRGVDPRSYVLMGPLLQDGLRRHQHQRVANAENRRQGARHGYLQICGTAIGASTRLKNRTAE